MKRAVRKKQNKNPEPQRVNDEKEPARGTSRWVSKWFLQIDDDQQGCVWGVEDEDKKIEGLTLYNACTVVVASNYDIA
jgi:hypothetical protein